MRPKLSYPNVMSTLCFFLLLGGSAYAATHLGKNSVGSKQLKKNAVTTAKIKNEAVTAAKVKKGTLMGAQINASTLGTVPDASHAKSADHANSADAVGGASVVKFEHTGGASAVTVASLGGLQLEYACDEPSDALTFWATTSVDGASIWLSRTNAVNTALESKEPFDSSELFPLLGFVGTGVYTAPGGRVVTFTYRNSNHCKSGVAGTAYGG
jgi:hypothetical protein